ncbi:protein ARV 2-like isoform X2 [Cicer arietinum]|uniref:Protein ARV n=1 Tax=Cicer arietinum TaxID=3827 RepID=A0A1S2XRG5_CICAR|nr:protein arv1 homolog isoform X2 [Cicer arietinum]
MGYKCIQCGFTIKTLYLQYSPGNIRLMKCDNCKAVADEYIECEFMIIVIDLILHKPKAYRHLLYNVINQETLKFQGLLWKLASIFLLFDAYKCLILEYSKGKLGSSMSYSSLVSLCCKMLMDVFLGNFMFLLTFFFMVKIFLHISIGVSRCNDILLGLLISCYFKIFLIAMMVWEFPSSVVFIIELFCFSSNAVALKVMTESSMSRCVWTCFSAYAIKLFITQAPELILLGKLMQGWSQMPFTLSLKSTFI